MDHLSLTLTLTLIFLSLSLSPAPSPSLPPLPPLNHIISGPAGPFLHSPPISRSLQNPIPKPISVHRHRHPPPPPPPPPPDKLNLGKKVGFLFAAIAAALQVTFAVFLVYKRWQLKWMGRNYRMRVSS